MRESPKGLRRQIAVMGRRNAGKSSLINALARQEVSIVSSTPGTTTDPVEKTMEMAPLGPVVLVDTAGIDDLGPLGWKRAARGWGAMRRMDAVIIVLGEEGWGEPEKEIANRARADAIPFIVVQGKMDLGPAKSHDLPANAPYLEISAKSGQGVEEISGLLAKILGEAEEAHLLAGLVSRDSLVIFVAPLDSGAPKGRLILPQVQAIRDCLELGGVCMVLTEKEYEAGLAKLARLPDLVVCDSQVVETMAALTPPTVPLTTFSILMARLKGDLAGLARGAAALSRLKPGDALLVQEACSHHPQTDDIGRVKLPRLLRRMAGGELDIRFAAGKELAAYDPELRAIVHCGACVITPRQMRVRQGDAQALGIAMTNYGMAISQARGVLRRVLEPFPDALGAYDEEAAKAGEESKKQEEAI